MAGRMLRMLDVRELIRRFRAGDIDRTAAREFGVARKTVARYRDLAKRKGLLDGTAPAARRAGTMPPYVTFYIGVTDVKASLDKAVSQGGKVVQPPTPIPGVGVSGLFQGA